MRLAFYDFAVSPHSYDFLSFLCGARAAGTNHIVFVPGDRKYQKLSEEQRAFRLKNLLLPLCEQYTVCESREEAQALLEKAEAVFPHGYTVEKPRHAHMLFFVVNAPALYPQPAKAEAIERVNQYLGERRVITITMRESPIRPSRNSNREAWIKAADWMQKMGLEPLFIPDTEGTNNEFGAHPVCREAADDVNFRIALYELAALNLGIGNGPMMACFYSYRPMLMFKPLINGHWECSADYWLKQGIPPGVQPQWFTDAQRLVWFPDDYEVIVEYVKRWGKVQAGKDQWENFMYPAYAYPEPDQDITNARQQMFAEAA